MTELRDAALEYALRGWRVFPLHSARPDGTCTCGRGEDCSSPAKHPRTANGFKNATDDAKAIRRSWTANADANIGVATGEISGFVVLDVDPDHGGEDTLAALEQEHGALPTVARALTGGEGFHYLFRHPGERIRNNAGTKLGPGLDVRGDGGYIVAAPSRHVSGNRYEWLALPAASEALPDLPGWLLERIRDPEPPTRTATAPVATRPVGELTPYARRALESEGETVLHAPQGRRNATLNDAAFNLGQLVAGGELIETDVVAALTAAAHAAGLTPHETDLTIRSGLAAGGRSPRRAPEPKTRVTSPNIDSGPSSEGRKARPLPNEPEPPDDPPPAEQPTPDDDEPGSTDDTDLGNARRLVAGYGHLIRWVPQWGAWLYWDGARWAKDITGQVERYAKKVSESILVEAFTEADDEKRKKRVRFAFDSQRRSRLEAMVALARTEPGIPVQPHELDADKWVINCRNGTIDLKTGVLHPHRPEQLITKLVPVAYDPAAISDVWDRFMDTTAGGDHELYQFLQRAVGYSLTGDTGEEVLFFVHGPAAAGKSTFIDAIEATLGEYAKRADFETFLARNQSTAGGARGDIARLIGARFCTGVEVDEGAKLAEGLVKNLTGGDLITARFLYKDEFEFRPQFKLWLAANHAPRVKHGDEAMWRRILRIPFEHVIPKSDRDPAVKAALRDPDVGGPAILAWAVQGCLAWQRQGLAAPGAITRATDAYRADMDPLRGFLEDRCTFGPDQWVTGTLLRRSYEEWCRENGQRSTLSPNAFAATLEEHGARNERRRIAGAPTRIWERIGLRDEWTGEAPAPGSPAEPEALTFDEGAHA